MGSVILVRHGETVWNSLGKYQGQQDIPLSAVGINQGNRLADFFQNWTINAVYSSDLQRAYDTAALIASRHNLTVHVDQRLREYAMGEWEGLTREQVMAKYRDIYNRRTNDINVRPPGGESGAEVKTRVLQWLHEIIETELETVVAVSHSGTIRALLAGLLEIDIRKAKFRLDNCGFSIVEWGKTAGAVSFQIRTINSRLDW